MKSDIEINQSTTLLPIADVAAKLDIGSAIEPYGRYAAKINLEDIADKVAPITPGKLILVTAISPSPPGEGKTTTTIGLNDALNLLGKKSIVCLREPALGPVFGLKGGATGGGYAQVAPMEDINLHFTGDFAAIASAHNLLAAMIDNHIYHGNELNIDPNKITWRRVTDMNDRALRKTVVALGGNNGATREDGFDIVVASEVMAILCLADSIQDLKKRLNRITVGYTYDNKKITAKDLNAGGAMTALLKHAIKPNLVQTLEGNPALIHGGPFANIAHGCNSIIATRLGLKLADYVVTEAGFGADLGAEKFIDIKCRVGGLKPDAVVLVATVRALKYHGDGNLQNGFDNLDKHVKNITQHFNLPCVVAINKFKEDTVEDLTLLLDHIHNDLEVAGVVCTHWADGGTGAVNLADEIIHTIDTNYVKLKFAYEDTDTLWNKIRNVARKIYGAEDITADAKVTKQIEEWQKDYGHYPVCIAKTPYSFSTDPKLLDVTDDHVVNIREVRLCTGAGFIVVICGDIMTLPGLPVVPNAERIGIDSNGNIKGLD